jgi:hypothetical protein
VERFVARNQAALDADAARGSGQSLFELARVAGCQDLPELSLTLHGKHAVLFRNGEPSGEVLGRRLVAHMRERRELRCVDVEERRIQSTAGRRRVLAAQSPHTGFFMGSCMPLSGVAITFC